MKNLENNSNYKKGQSINSKYRGNGTIIEVQETACLIRYNDNSELLTSFSLMNQEIKVNK